MAVRLEGKENRRRSSARAAVPDVETINESRATRERDTGGLFSSAADPTSARNQLIWGDNRLVMSSLLAEYAGAVKLVYIDPPFDTGVDFSHRVTVGDTSVDKFPSVLEEHAYRDTWGRGRESYLSMVYERLVLIHELLAADGSLDLHCAPNVSHYLKLVCDEIFGPANFRSEIIWKRTTAHSDTKQGRALHGGIHDVILFYTKSDEWIWNTIYVPYDEAYIDLKYRFVDEETGRRYRLGDLTAAKPGGDTSFEWHGRKPYKGRDWAYSREKLDQMHAEGRIRFPDKPDGVPEYKRYLDEMPGVPLQDVWTDLDPINARALERLGYPTQKPETLVDRIVKTSSNEGDLVADLFCGSGTSLVVAERSGRRWLGCDLGRFAIHTTRKRLLNVPDCRPFEIRNLGAYERQRWQVESGNGALRAYLDTILTFYRADPVGGFAHLHGRKAGRMVHVGATDAPVTIDETEDVMDEMADNGVESCDILGWEWEMGLHDTITERARRRGLDVRPRQIPREVMERQVTEAEAVRFFELAHVDLDVRWQGHEVCVVLKDFAIPSEELIPPKVRERIESWADLIDYWSVDFDYSDEVFHNQWQAYRTRETPALLTQSGWHEYSGPGRYSIVVKIIDIFGNDTTKLAEVRIK